MVALQSKSFANSVRKENLLFCCPHRDLASGSRSAVGMRKRHWKKPGKGRCNRSASAADRPPLSVFPYFYYGLPASGPGFQNMNSLGVVKMHSTSKSSLHTRYDNPPIRKDNCIVLLTSISILKRDHPMWDRLRLKLTRHKMK
jgi:hypothetical protein